MTITSAANVDSSILVIGAGTWGCSTALHLARRGYKNVTVLDLYELPSPISAGNDVNKIVELGTLLSQTSRRIRISNIAKLSQLPVIQILQKTV